MTRRNADTITDDELDALYAEREFVHQVLDLFARADLHGELLWHTQDGVMRFAANVRDVFAWGGGDAEDITPETLHLLEQALVDCRAADAEGYTAELYAARIRGMRPQGAAYPKTAAAQALFDACGPERAVGFGNPKAPPVPVAS